MTFEKFRQIVEENRRLGVRPEAEISHVCAGTCNMRVEDNVSMISIEQLVTDICENGMGNISNPEALKNWTGWDYDAKTEHVYLMLAAVEKDVFDTTTKRYRHANSFELVHPSGCDLPYLARSEKSFWSTRDLYNLFCYVPEKHIARYIPDVKRCGNICMDVQLRDDQIALIEKAIKEKHFYN